MEVTAFWLAQRYLGVAELPGAASHPLIQWWLSLCGLDLTSADEIPWCSAFANGVAWELRLVRSKSARARSWLEVGLPIILAQATPGFDVVVFNRGGDPNPQVIDSPGHVGFYAGLDPVTGKILVLAGNQGNRVSIAGLPASQLLGVRRLVPG